MKIDINDFAILVNGPPKVLLLAVDLDEYFIDVEGVAIASVFSLQAAGIYGAELDTPEPDGFSGYSYAAFG